MSIEKHTSVEILGMYLIQRQKYLFAYTENLKKLVCQRVQCNKIIGKISLSFVCTYSYISYCYMYSNLEYILR